MTDWGCNKRYAYAIMNNDDASLPLPSIAGESGVLYSTSVPVNVHCQCQAALGRERSNFPVKARR